MVERNSKRLRSHLLREISFKVKLRSCVLDHLFPYLWDFNYKNNRSVIEDMWYDKSKDKQEVRNLDQIKEKIEQKWRKKNDYWLNSRNHQIVGQSKD